MTNEEIRVWEAIKTHVGMNRSITRPELVVITGVPDRLIRDIINSLRNEYGKIICSRSSKPGGYFVAESIEELRMCHNIELARENSIRENRLFYARALKESTSKQLSMFSEVVNG